MKGVILCAGYGERLRPFTDFLPKSLFPIVGRPIIDNTIIYLKQTSIDEICVNTHHMSYKISQYLNENSFGIKIHKFYEASLLGTGGGIGNMRDYLQETFIVSNCDILTNIDLNPAIELHKKEKAIITLVLHNYTEYNKIAVSPSNNNIISIDRETLPNPQDKLAFTGISIMSPEVFNLIPYKEYSDIHDVYGKLILTGKLKGYVAKGHLNAKPPLPARQTVDGHQGHYWIDIGTLKNYLNAHKDILINKVSTLFWDSPGVFLNIHIGKNSYISPHAQLKGFVSIGNNCKINDNVKLENCVVWDNIEIPKNTNENNTIIYA